MFGCPIVNVNAYTIYRCSGKYENNNIPLPQIPTTNIKPPWNRVAEPLLSCYYWVYGPVGLYWVLPLLLAMYVDEKTWHVEEVPAGDLEHNEQSGGAHLCPGLPKNSPIEVIRLSQEEWVKIYDLHRLFMSYQCDTLTGPPSSTQRLGQRDPSKLSSLYYPPENDILRAKQYLYIAVTAGIVLASAIVDEQSPVWLLVLLCSATRSGGGKFLMTHLKQHAPPSGMKLSPVKKAIPFYEGLGFEKRENDCTYMYWPCVGTRPIGPTRHDTHRQSSARSHPYKPPVIVIDLDSQ